MRLYIGRRSRNLCLARTKKLACADNHRLGDSSADIAIISRQQLINIVE